MKVLSVQPFEENYVNLIRSLKYKISIAYVSLYLASTSWEEVFDAYDVLRTPISPME